jgi:hypothetical protein
MTGRYRGPRVGNSQGGSRCECRLGSDQAGQVELSHAAHVNERRGRTSTATAALVSLASAAHAVSPEATRQIESLLTEKSARTAVQQKIGSQLIYGAKQASGLAVASGVSTLAAPTDAWVEEGADSSADRLQVR